MKKTDSTGGVIYRIQNGKAVILLIRHLDYNDWFLPKGHTEPGETVEQAALREIEEETGLTELEVVEFLGNFERVAHGAQELKTEHYFLIRKTSDQKERIEPGQNWEIRWFGKEELPIFYIPEQEKIVRDIWSKLTQ